MILVLEDTRSMSCVELEAFLDVSALAARSSPPFDGGSYRRDSSALRSKGFHHGARVAE
jgi:hypothetical protein